MESLQNYPPECEDLIFRFSRLRRSRPVQLVLPEQKPDLPCYRFTKNPLHLPLTAVDPLLFLAHNRSPIVDVRTLGIGTLC